MKWLCLAYLFCKVIFACLEWWHGSFNRKMALHTPAPILSCSSNETKQFGILTKTIVAEAVLDNRQIKAVVESISHLMN